MIIMIHITSNAQCPSHDLAQSALHTHAHKHTQTHAHTHARTHARTHTHTEYVHTYTVQNISNNNTACSSPKHSQPPQHIPPHARTHTHTHARPRACRSEGKLRSGQTGGQSNPHKSGLLLGRSEVLRSLRHYLLAQSQGHHTVDRMEERGVERESAR